MAADPRMLGLREEMPDLRTAPYGGAVKPVPPAAVGLLTRETVFTR